MKRDDDYKQRRAHLADLNDEQLKQRFWELAEKLVEPILELGYKNTTPAIERSIILRMGFSSIEAKPIVVAVMNQGLMKYGAGNVVWRLSKKLGISVREAGVAIANGKYLEELPSLFEKIEVGK